MTQKHEVRLDHHFAENATPPFIGVFATTKEAYESGDAPDADDVVQIPVNPRDGVVCDLLQDAVESACNHANEGAPSSAAQALSLAAKSLHDSGKATNPAVANLAEAFMAASRKMTEVEKTSTPNSPESVHGDVLWVGNVGVSFENIGEGHDGEYDANDPNDEPLLRLDFMEFDEVGGQRETEGSGCTQVNAVKATKDQRQRFLEMAMAYAHKHVVNGPRSFKHLVGALTWQGRQWDGILGFGFDAPAEIGQILAKYPEENPVNTDRPRG